MKRTSRRRLTSGRFSHESVRVNGPLLLVFFDSFSLPRYLLCLEPAILAAAPKEGL
jgi:hypothetical protein